MSDALRYINICLRLYEIKLTDLYEQWISPAIANKQIGTYIQKGKNFLLLRSISLFSSIIFFYLLLNYYFFFRTHPFGHLKFPCIRELAFFYVRYLYLKNIIYSKSSINKLFLCYIIIPKFEIMRYLKL